MSNPLEVHTPNDHSRGFVEYPAGNGRTLRMYMGGGEPPMHPRKVIAATEFRETTLPLILEKLFLFRANKLPMEELGDLLNAMRDNRAACNAFERVERVTGHAFLESFNQAIDGVQAARFGDRRYENAVGAFLSLVDRLFPKMLRVAEAAAHASVAPAAPKK